MNIFVYLRLATLITFLSKQNGRKHDILRGEIHKEFQKFFALAVSLSDFGKTGEGKVSAKWTKC